MNEVDIWNADFESTFGNLINADPEPHRFVVSSPEEWRRVYLGSGPILFEPGNPYSGDTTHHDCDDHSNDDDGGCH